MSMFPEMSREMSFPSFLPPKLLNVKFPWVVSFDVQKDQPPFSFSHPCRRVYFRWNSLYFPSSLFPPTLLKRIQTHSPFPSSSFFFFLLPIACGVFSPPFFLLDGPERWSPLPSSPSNCTPEINYLRFLSCFFFSSFSDQ